MIASAIIVAIFGARLQIVTLRPLIGRDPLNTILVDLRHFARAAELSRSGISALWQRQIPEPFSAHFTLFYLQYPWYRIMIAALSAAIIGGL